MPPIIFYIETSFAPLKKTLIFVEVVDTANTVQLVMISVQPGQSIHNTLETHTYDQVIVFVEGNGTAFLNGQTLPVKQNDAVFLKAGTDHNFTNTSNRPLKLFTTYSPVQFAPGTVMKTKP